MGESAKISECAARSSAVAALDLGRCRRLRRKIENNTKCVAIDTDKLEFWTGVHSHAHF
jgi:hypothetical protein